MPFYFIEPTKPYKSVLSDEKAVKVSGDFGLKHGEHCTYRISEARKLHENLSMVILRCDEWERKQIANSNIGEIRNV